MGSLQRESGHERLAGARAAAPQTRSGRLPSATRGEARWSPSSPPRDRANPPEEVPEPGPARTGRAVATTEPHASRLQWSRARAVGARLSRTSRATCQPGRRGGAGARSIAPMRATARERASRREQLDGCMLRRTASLLRTELARDAFARPTHAPSTLRPGRLLVVPLALEAGARRESSSARRSLLTPPLSPALAHALKSSRSLVHSWFGPLWCCIIGGGPVDGFVLSG